MEKSKTTETGKGETGEEQSQGMLIIFFDVKGIYHKKFVLACQTVNSAYHCDVLGRLHKNVLRLRREMLRHDNAPSRTSFFAKEFLIKKNMTGVPHPPNSSDVALCNFPVSTIEDETKRPPF
jgi:hypothetical protein